MLLNKGALDVAHVTSSNAAPHNVLQGAVSFDATKTFAVEFATEYAYIHAVWSLRWII